jgi:hypothetical protein
VVTIPTSISVGCGVSIVTVADAGMLDALIAAEFGISTECAADPAEAIATSATVSPDPAINARHSR